MLGDEIITEYAWVVNTVLKKLGLEKDEDMRQEALLCMWKCAKKYDPNAGVKFSTYAYKSTYFYILRLNKKETEKRKLTVSAEKLFSLSDENLQSERLVNTCQIKTAADGLTKKEKKCADYFAQGYTKKEIQQKMKLSKKSVALIVKSIRHKIPPP